MVQSSRSMNEEQEDLNFDVRFPARRKLVWFLVISFSLVALVFGAYQIENWRGRSAWKKYQREQEAKGETFDIRKLAPPAVPDASNFASVPMFAKLFDYYRDSSGKNVWRDTNAVNEDVFRIYRTYTQTKPPDLGNWILGQKIDLSEWQAHYRKTRFEASELNVKSEQVIPFPVRDQIGTPEEDVLLALSKHDDALTELREASARPFSCYPIRYEDNVSTLLPHLMRLGAASQFLAI